MRTKIKVKNKKIKKTEGKKNLKMFFLVLVFPHLFGPNTGKYGPEKTSYFNTFHAVFLLNQIKSKSNYI